MSRIIFGEVMVELSQTADGLYRRGFAGDTYNTAIYLKRLSPEQQVSYLTALGEDNLSDQLLSRMRQEGLNTERVYRLQDKTLGLYMISTDPQGERSFSYWRSDSAARQTLALLAQDSRQGQLEDCQSFYFSGISLGILADADKEALLTLVEKLRQQSCQVIFDPNYRPRLWQNVEQARAWTDRAYELADLAFPGADDHLALYGHGNGLDIVRHVQALGVREIVLKSGERGIQVVSPEQHCIVPVFKVDKVVDTTAAGDAFNGGYMAARFCGHSPREAAQQGARIAAKVIGFAGAIIDIT